jgi:hypothetical protein
VALKLRARLSRLLAPLCVGATLLALTASACSVPEFEFPGQAIVVGVGGDGNQMVVGEHCANGMLDSDTGESDFDCGRGCLPCAAGKHCVDAADCQASLLCHDGSCLEAGCMNGAQDSAETDLDCGGTDCKPCITGKVCAAATDCDSGVCGDGKCLAPACDDRTTNGKETGLDCGGDCPPCAADQPCVVAKDCSSTECNAGVCGAECPDGFANCDKKNDNACEVNTRTDLSNCGFCGNLCTLPHATAECSAGECHIKTDGCEVGYQDCNGDPADGCEVDLKTNKLNCGVCNKVCPDLNGTPSCAGGLCQIACNDGFQDCDDSRDDGCEINTKTSSKNCSTCSKVCKADAGYSPFCKDGACGQTMCPAGKGDCNGEQADGCEINVTNDINNCGACGTVCSANKGSVACVNSKCVITSCDAGYADCDVATAGGYQNGCETDTTTSTTNCGGCGKACNIANGTPACVKGSCEVNSCSSTFRDCDSDPKTGCEVNVATNTKNCGGCGNMGSDCSAKYANAVSSCAGSACSAPTCNSGFGDCSGGIADGCETNTTNSGNNCGGCGLSCSTAGSAHVSSNACANSQCTPICSGSYLTCDNNKLNGCESDSTMDENNCGACGTVCNGGASAHVTSNLCTGSACDPQCSGTYGDCDASRTNGCEVDTATSGSNCGGCGKVCSTAAAAHVSTNACTGSSCHPACSGGFDDCDGNHLNGCEKDISGDKSNCGACGTVCGSTNASATSCGAGTCSPTCNSGWGKCATPEKGCVTPLGTVTNCTACGDACNSPTKFCDPAGCVDHRDIGIGASANAISGWNASGAASILSVDHALSFAKGNNRMVIVGVVASDTFLDPESVQYDGKDMTRAVWAQDTDNQSYAAVYYMLEAQLPDPGTKTVTVTFASTPVWGHGGFDVLELKNTMQVAPIANGMAIGSNCGGGNGVRNVTVNFTQTGSLVYAVMSGRGALSVPTLTANGPIQHWNDHVSSPNNHTGSSAYVFDNDNRTFQWTFNDCYNSAAVGVAVKRLNWN